MRAFLERFDRWWTRLEVGLTVGAAALLVLSLVAWVALKGLSCRTTATFVAGLVFRAVTLGAGFGVVTYRLTRRWPTRRNVSTFGAVLVGAGLGVLVRNLAVDYFANVLGWLQDGSTLTLVGGLRGLATRLTLLLALLGASLATATGRHVSIDVATRAFGEAFKVPLAKVGGLLAAVVCAFAAWGFLDFAAVDHFGAKSELPRWEKVSAVASGVSRNFFLARRQLALDLRVAGRVLGGAPWDRSFTGEEWNDWLDAGDVVGHLGPQVAEAMRDTAGGPRAPLLAVPGAQSRGLLVKTLNLVIPFGLMMVALRFVLWLLRGAPQAPVHGEPKAPVHSEPKPVVESAPQ